MRMNKRFVFFLLFLTISLCSFAQGNIINNAKTALDAMFAGLDKGIDKVPTGFLWDISANIVEVEDYNGSPLKDSVFVDLPLLGDLLQSINSASVEADTLCVQAVLSRIKSYSSYSNQAVGFLFQPYNYIVPNALTDNLITYSNGLVSDSYVNGIWQNPYGEAVLFCHAIGEDVLDNEYITYTIMNVDSLSTRISRDSIQFDPGDGLGYRALSSNWTVTAHYTEEDLYETMLKVVYNNQEYISRSLISIKLPHNAQHSASKPPRFLTHEITANYEGVDYKAMVCYDLSRCFDNPLIVSEGFDPWGLYDASNDTTFHHDYSGFTDIEKIVDHSKNNQYPFFDNYNVFYVDWYNPDADIRANAAVLKEVIKWVNSNKQSGNPNIVMGQSMGGLIARYALCDMERRGESHQTDLFISHDVPYRGANVPIGALFMYRDILHRIDSSMLKYAMMLYLGSEKYQVLKSMGEWQSVKQMLPYYVNSSRQYERSEYLELQDTLSFLGYPSGDHGHIMENVAIVNGGRTGGGALSRYTNGDKILDLSVSISSGILTEVFIEFLRLLCINTYMKKDFWQMLIPGKTSLVYDLTIYPYLFNSTLVFSSNIYYKKKFLWLIDGKEIDPIYYPYYAPSNGAELDALPGSTFSTVFKELSGSDHDPIYLLFGGFDVTCDHVDRIMFIPTSSAFDEGLLYKNYYSNPPVPCGSGTPFGSYIVRDTATTHISFYGNVSDWLTKVRNTELSGPDLPDIGDIYSITGNAASGLSFTWSTSNSNKVSIDSSTGEITGGRGVVTVVATHSNNSGQIITKRKEVMVGVPRITIDYANTGSNYTAWADYHYAEDKAFVREHGVDSLLLFNWKLKQWNAGGDSLVQVLPNHSDTVSFSLSNSYSYASVALEVVLGSDKRDSTYCSLVTPDVFYVNLFRINVNNDVVCFIFYPFGEIPFYMSEGDPMLILKPIPGAALDNITNLIPSYATVAGFDFPVQPHPTETGYYIVDCFYTYQSDSFDHFWLVNSVLRAIRLSDSIVIQVYNSSDQLLQTMSYRIGRFPFL